MTKTCTCGRLLVLALVLCGSLAHGQDELDRRATWNAPSTAQVKAQLDRWLADRNVSDDQRKQINALWITDSETEAKPDPTANLTRLVESAALAWPAAQEVVEPTRQVDLNLPLEQYELLALEEKADQEDIPASTEEESNSNDSAEEQPAEETPTEADTPKNDSTEEATEVAADAAESDTAEETESAETPADREAWLVNNLRLHYARWLAQHEMYDESLELIEPLTSEQVVDPASLLFYQSAAYHFLLNKPQGLATIEKLLENEESIARRYSITAKLMAADLKPLKTDSLDEIARMMDDVERRLRLQRAGKRVRKEEDDVVAKLDKMIEELEKQQQQQQQSGSGAGNSNAPSQPMQDSQIGGASGEGNVDPKRLAARENWGNLPPKQRQEALQQITKELPAHYREAVEEYFRKLARDGVNP